MGGALGQRPTTEADAGRGIEEARDAAMMRALIFDLDGTLVDTVYGHTLAWWRVLQEAKLPVAGWKVHRLIGMSGGLITKAAAHELGRDLSAEEVETLQHRHGQVYRELLPEREPLPGALDLLRHLRNANIKHAIATSGKMQDAKPSL